MDQHLGKIINEAEEKKIKLPAQIQELEEVEKEYAEYRDELAKYNRADIQMELKYLERRRKNK